MVKSYIADHFVVLKQQYFFVREITNGLDDQTYKLFVHILASTLHKTKTSPGNLFSDIPMATIGKKIGRKADWRKLRERKLIDFLDYITEKKARSYKAQNWVLDRWHTINRSLSYDEHLKAERVDLLTGKPSIQEPKTKLTKPRDGNRNQLPKSTKEALKTIDKNKSCFCRKSVESWLDNQEKEIERLKRKAEILRETDGVSSESYKQARGKYRRIKRRREGAYDLYVRVLHRKSTRHVEGDIWEYRPAYQIVNGDGRVVVRGGGFQGVPREMKAAAYSCIPDVHNYDIESAHPNAFRYLLKEAGIDSSWLDKVLKTRVGNKSYKQIYAEEVGIDPDTWKKIFIGVSVYLGDLPVQASEPIRLPGNKEQKIRRYIWEAAGGDLQNMQVLIDRLREQLAPSIKTRKQWSDWLINNYVPRNKQRSIRNGREYIVNGVG